MAKSDTLDLEELRLRYRAALIKGDRSSATAAVEQGLHSGLDTPTLLLEVLGAAQREIGEMWHRGEVTVAQEHWGTEVTKAEVERVLQNRPSSRDLGRSVVVATVPSENHTLAARLVAGLFTWHGWSVDYLGTAPPPDELVYYVQQQRPDLVALSITLAEHREDALAVCEKLQQAPSPPPVLLGGAAAAGLDADTVGVTAVASDFQNGLKLAEKLVDLEGERPLEAYLALVGRRIQKHRHTARISQTELAHRAALTRPYLSAVERGKQNFTLEAALKIAKALNISMADLLDEGR